MSQFDSERRLLVSGSGYASEGVADCKSVAFVLGGSTPHGPTSFAVEAQIAGHLTGNEEMVSAILIDGSEALPLTSAARILLCNEDVRVQLPQAALMLMLRFSEKGEPHKLGLDSSTLSAATDSGMVQWQDSGL